MRTSFILYKRDTICPGAEPDLAFFITACISIQVGSFKSKSIDGGVGVIRDLFTSKSRSLFGSFSVSLRKASISSVELSICPLRFSPSNFFVKPNGFEIKAILFRALSFLRRLCYCALRKDFIFALIESRSCCCDFFPLVQLFCVFLLELLVLSYIALFLPPFGFLCHIPSLFSPHIHNDPPRSWLLFWMFLIAVCLLHLLLTL